ncbi:MAG: hypothetical protein MUF27_17905 [Acidobacteria bacterium]|nr:hypothetical protein [Acidobacteriota bacterium]
MAGIGMLFAAPASRDPNIEDTLIAASVDAMERDDLRVASVLTTWLGIHHPRLNADRLVRALTDHPSKRVLAYWSAMGRWLQKDARLARLEGLYGGPPVELLRSGTAFHVRRRGEDPRFHRSKLRVPAGVLRDRTADVMSPRELAARHGTYRLRIVIGASYRADMWAELERDPELSAAELARRAYGSFATAWKVRQDWALLHPEAPAGGGRRSRGAGAKRTPRSRWHTTPHTDSSRP